MTKVSFQIVKSKISISNSRKLSFEFSLLTLDFDHPRNFLPYQFGRPGSIIWQFAKPRLPCICNSHLDRTMDKTWKNPLSKRISCQTVVWSRWPANMATDYSSFYSSSVLLYVANRKVFLRQITTGCNITVPDWASGWKSLLWKI